jgi:hypothetical protein
MTFRGGHADHDQHELVTADSRHDIGLAHAGAQPLGHTREHRIAGAMAETVIDRLESVEINAK